MSVIEKILKLMEEKQVTARKLTTELGLANSSVSEWKKGKAKPSLEAVVKIAKYFGVTTDFLLLEGAEEQGAPVSKQAAPLGQRPPEPWALAQDSLESGLSERESLEREPFESDLPESKRLNQVPSEQKLRNYRSHVSSGVWFPAELSKDEKTLLECYQRLDEEDKEYIRCKMVVMKRESVD